MILTTNGAHAAAEDLRDLSLGQVLVVAQNHDRTLSSVNWPSARSNEIFNVLSAAGSLAVPASGRSGLRCSRRYLLLRQRLTCW